MKNISIISQKHKLKQFFTDNIIFRLLRLILSPKNLVRKIFEYKSKKKNKIEKINWTDRAKLYGKYSVLDKRTPISEFNYVTKEQKKILFNNLKKYTSGKEKNILDFGCGTGRFSAELLKISKKARVTAVDKEKKLVNMANKNKKIDFIHLSSLNKIKKKFDLIFIINVLGGIQDKELKKIAFFLKKKLNKNGILILNENINNNFDSKKLFKFWVDRSEKYYKNLFKQLNLEKIDQYKYLDNFNVIFIGKKT